MLPSSHLLTCMMSMAMAWVCTPSTMFTSQCTTSALMKQDGERPFCSESSWIPVLKAKQGTGEGPPESSHLSPTSASPMAGLHLPPSLPERGCPEARRAEETYVGCFIASRISSKVDDEVRELAEDG